jgi:predicted DNA-binding helix-hairpin-helix protein
MPFVGDGNLPLEMDPKMAWAQIHLAEHPVEINRASREELLRVPGFGPQAVISILQARQHKLFSQLESLGKLSINSQRAAPFILLNGKHPARQLSFAF